MSTPRNIASILVGLLLLSFYKTSFGAVIILDQLEDTVLQVEHDILVFHDPSKQLKLEDLPVDQFRPYPEFRAHANLDQALPGHIWLSLSINNTRTDTAQIVFFPGLFNEITFYEADQIPRVNGYYFSNNKAVHPLACMYALKIPPQSNTTLTVQVQGRFKKEHIRLELYDAAYLNLYPPPLLTQLFASASFQLVFFGAVLFVIVFSLIQYFLVKEKAYIFYAIYIIGICAYFLREFEKFSPELSLFFTYYPSLDKHFETPIAVYIYCTYILFLIRFLDIKKYHPTYYRISRYIFLMFIIYLLVDKLLWFLVDPSISIQFYYIFRAACLFAGLYYGYLLLSIKTQLSIYVMAGTTCLLIGVGINLYYSYQLRVGLYSIQGFWDYPQTYTQLGTIIEIVFFSVGLGYKNRMEIVEKNQALLKAMRSQMNPHFIFNCLNSIKALIYKKDTQNAVRYLTQFAKLFRKVLQHSDKTLVTLEEELNMSKLYLNMEQLRFKDQFEFSISTAADLSLDQVLVPPMVFQPYLENALWHGLLHKYGERRLAISIEKRADNIYCLIDDNGIGRAKAMQLKRNKNNQQKSYGMQLARNRLAYHNISVNIIDKMDDAQNATGTQIEIVIKP